MPNTTRRSDTHGMWGVTTVVVLGLGVCVVGLIVATLMTWIMR